MISAMVIVLTIFLRAMILVMPISIPMANFIPISATGNKQNHNKYNNLFHIHIH